ncbi:MAG TPA: hypothetical protein PK986_03675 [Spirochaetota bacterium]|mgnify:CR=1 FL=1|nr:hypothetical protein [Spirochaetota bacterium]
MNFRNREKNRAPLDTVIQDCFNLLKAGSSRSETLKYAADRAISRFGDYITPGDLNLTDEIEIILIELLDQIVYEFRENSEYDNNIKDYIIDDLYSRLVLILEALNNKGQYLKNLKNRTLYHDDLVIIKKMNLSEVVPLLVNESEDITDLQVPIAKTLLSFTDDLYLDYYYNMFRNSTSGILKALSLLGLKYSSSKGLNWKILREAANGMSGLVQYAEEFSLSALGKNRFPETGEEYTLALLHTEKEINNITDNSDAEWILNLLNSAPQYNFDKAWHAEIDISLGNILLGINLKLLEKILRDEKILINAACMIDRLPKNIFNRITGRLDELGVEFIFNLNAVIEKKKVPVNDYNSNIISYLCLNGGNTF